MKEKLRSKTKKILQMDKVRLVEKASEYLGILSLTGAALALASLGIVFAVYGMQMAILYIPLRIFVGLLVSGLSFLGTSIFVGSIGDYLNGEEP